MPQRLKRKVFIAFVTTCITVFVGLVMRGFVPAIVPHAEALNDLEPGYDGWESRYEYIDIDTTWSKGDSLAFDKPVFIDYGATLTIEAGAFVRLDGGDLIVRSGNIVAQGTREEPITFTSDDLRPFTIVFWDYPIEQGWGKTSDLRYVHIESGGSYDDPDDCGGGNFLMMRLPSLIDTAFASGGCASGTPAIHYRSGRVRIDHADFTDNRYADILVESGFSENEAGDFIRVSASNFGSNLQGTSVIAQGYCIENTERVPCHHDEIVMQGNWWGDPEGPRFEAHFIEFSNFAGRENEVVGWGDISLGSPSREPFDNGIRQPIPCVEDCFSNVLFLPGVEASRLYAKDDPSCMAINCENQLWEPNRNDDVSKLYLNENGKSVAAYDIYTRDILDETNIAGQNIYKSFIAKMDALKNDEHLINDWAPVPYDWRLSLEDIVNGGTSVTDGFSYADTTETPRIIAELERLAATSRTGKVTIVTHSNGGLVAKALMQKIGDAETQRLIDTVIFVGVPQVGTPVAIGAMLHGYDQSLAAGLLLDKPTARGLAEYMPSAYTLLPSAAYFDAVKTPVVSFDAQQLPEWRGKYGDVIDAQVGLRNFLADAYERVDATDSDIEHPSGLHANLLNQADARHEGVDTWRAPEGVKAIQIAGWGVPLTVGGMHYTTETKYIVERGALAASYEDFKAEPLFTIDGDGTVVAPSALFMADAERYWLDLDSYNIFLIRHVNHSDILEVPELEDFIEDIIIKSVKPVAEYEYISTEVPPFGTKDRLQYSLHSPLTFDLYDDQGRHTGLDADGNIEEQIPGTYYRQFGEVKYIFSDVGAKFHIVMKGYATGTFTLEVEQLQGDVSVGKIVYKDMPTTDKTDVSIDISENIDGAGNLSIDEDGDGTVDYRIRPEKGKSVTLAGTSEPATTIYTASFDATLKKLTVKKDVKKHANKKQKRNGRSKREQKREIKIKKALASKTPVRVESKRPTLAAITQANKETEEKKDESAMPPTVAGDSMSTDSMLESDYRPPSEDEKIVVDQGWKSKSIQMTQDILRKISDMLHSFLNRWVK